MYSVYPRHLIKKKKMFAQYFLTIFTFVLINSIHMNDSADPSISQWTVGKILCFDVRDLKSHCFIAQTVEKNGTDFILTSKRPLDITVYLTTWKWNVIYDLGSIPVRSSYCLPAPMGGEQSLGTSCMHVLDMSNNKDLQCLQVFFPLDDTKREVTKINCESVLNNIQHV